MLQAPKLLKNVDYSKEAMDIETAARKAISLLVEDFEDMLQPGVQGRRWIPRAGWRWVAGGRSGWRSGF